MASRTSGFVVQPFLEGIRRGQRSVLLVVVGGEPVPVYGMVKMPRGWPGGRIVNGFARVDVVLEVETVNPEGGLQCASSATQRHWVACFSHMLEEAARAASSVATPTLG